MKLEINVLGCGSSSGVPAIGKHPHFLTQTIRKVAQELQSSRDGHLPKKTAHGRVHRKAKERQKACRFATAQCVP